MTMSRSRERIVFYDTASRLIRACSPTTVEPSNESYTPCRTPSPVPLPKTGPEDSIDIVDESEDERTRRRPNTSTRRRRIIRDPDSESEAESSQSRAKVAELVDLSSDGDEEDEGEGKGPVHGYDIVKHYDESYGSLGDFIVDDHTSEEEDGSEEEEEDNHMLRYSPPPRPALRLPDFRSLSLDDSPSPALTPARSKNVVGSKMCRRQWEGERERIAQGIFAELNKKVFEGKLEGTKIEWSKRLLTTAGTATSSR